MGQSRDPLPRRWQTAQAPNIVMKGFAPAGVAGLGHGNSASLRKTWEGTSCRLGHLPGDPGGGGPIRYGSAGVSPGVSPTFQSGSSSRKSCRTRLAASFLSSGLIRWESSLVWFDSMTPASLRSVSSGVVPK